MVCLKKSAKLPGETLAASPRAEPVAWVSQIFHADWLDHYKMFYNGHANTPCPYIGYSVYHVVCVYPTVPVSGEQPLCSLGFPIPFLIVVYLLLHYYMRPEVIV